MNECNADQILEEKLNCITLNLIETIDLAIFLFPFIDSFIFIPYFNFIPWFLSISFCFILFSSPSSSSHSYLYYYFFSFPFILLLLFFFVSLSSNINLILGSFITQNNQYEEYSFVSFIYLLFCYYDILTYKTIVLV